MVRQISLKPLSTRGNIYCPFYAVQFPYMKSHLDAYWLRMQLSTAGIIYKGLRKPDEVTVLRSIRNWVAEWTHLAVAPNPRAQKEFFSGGGAAAVASILAPEDYWRWELKDLYKALTTHQFGVMCGGTAWILMRVYDYLGYETYTLNVGSPPESYFTHVVCLVRSNDGRLFVQDAQTGITLDFGRDTSSLKESIELIKLGKFPVEKYSQEVRKTLILPVDNIDDVTSDAWLMPEKIYRNPAKFKVIRSGVSIYENVQITHRDLSKNPWWPECSGFLRAEGFSNLSPLQLFLYPMGVSSIDLGWIGADSCSRNTESYQAKLLKLYIKLCSDALQS